MYQEDIVLCAASAYEEKYYLNEDFASLPDAVKDELRAMCTLFTVEVGGILELVFDEKGNLFFQTEADEGDLLYDEIGSTLKFKQLQEQKKELLEALEMYFKVFFLGEEGIGEE